MANAALAKANLHALRQVVAAIEEGRQHTGKLEETFPRDEAAGRLALGIEAFDARLEGGLPVSGLCELRAALTMDAGAATGFALALSSLVQERLRPERPILWISEREAGREAGLAHAAGLVSFGIAPSSLLTAHPRRLEEALWVAESALQTEAFSAVVLEVRGNPAKFGLTESRRLHLKAGRPACRSCCCARRARRRQAPPSFAFLLKQRLPTFAASAAIRPPARSVTLPFASPSKRAATPHPLPSSWSGTPMTVNFTQPDKTLFTHLGQRILTVLLPRLPTDRIARIRWGASWRSAGRPEHPPVVISARIRNAMRIAALDELAAGRLAARTRDR